MTAVSVVVSRASIRTVNRAPHITLASSSSPHVTCSANVAPNNGVWMSFAASTGSQNVRFGVHELLLAC